jgi:hypothetical protein
VPSPLIAHKFLQAVETISNLANKHDATRRCNFVNFYVRVCGSGRHEWVNAPKSIYPEEFADVVTMDKDEFYDYCLTNMQVCVQELIEMKKILFDMLRADNNSGELGTIWSIFYLLFYL